MAVEITRTELSASGLRREAARTKDAQASRQMLALVLEGKSRTGQRLRLRPLRVTVEGYL